MGAAIFCVGVMVNLHITLLLDRIEAWCTGGGSWFALKGVPDQDWGSLGVWGGLGEGPVVVCRLTTSPGNPSRGPGIWDLFTFYNLNFVAWSRAKPPAHSVAVSHFCLDLFTFYN